MYYYYTDRQIDILNIHLYVYFWFQKNSKKDQG